MDKCKKEKENIYRKTCEGCEYVGNCENVSEVKREENNYKGEIKMTDKEKKFLDSVDEKVYHCLQRGIDKMEILISMNSGDSFKFEITEENYNKFKTDTIIFNWLKLNDYGYKANTEVFIRKENISYYGIV